MKLAIIIPFLDHELLKYIISLGNSLKSILDNCDSIETCIVFVPQPSGGSQKLSCADHLDFLINKLKVRLTSVEIIRQNSRSTSLARNSGIDIAILNNCSHIYFHDISVGVSSDFARKINLMRNIFDYTYCGFPMFSEESLRKSKVDGSKMSFCQNELVKKVAYPAFNPYIWSYIFPLSLISEIRFDERLGPGDSTIVKAGEDYVFLNLVLSKNCFYTFTSSPPAHVYHPPRMVLDSKNLKYAKGQGYAYKTVFLRHRRLIDLIYIILFIGNAFKNVLLLKANSLKILSERVSGLFLRIN